MLFTPEQKAYRIFADNLKSKTHSYKFLSIMAQEESPLRQKRLLELYKEKYAASHYKMLEGFVEATDFMINKKKERIFLDDGRWEDAVFYFYNKEQVKTFVGITNELIEFCNYKGIKPFDIREEYLSQIRPIISNHNKQ